MKIISDRPIDNAQSIDKLPSPQKGHDKTRVRSSEHLSSASEVDLSESAQLLKKGLDAVKQSPDVDTAKLEGLKNKIRAGTYQVDAASIADRLVEEHLRTDFGKNTL